MIKSILAASLLCAAISGCVSTKGDGFTINCNLEEDPERACVQVIYTDEERYFTLDPKKDLVEVVEDLHNENVAEHLYFEF